MRAKLVSTRAAAKLTQKQAVGIALLADNIQASLSAAVRMAIDAGLEELLPEYAGIEVE